MSTTMIPVFTRPAALDEMTDPAVCPEPGAMWDAVLGRWRQGRERLVRCLACGAPTAAPWSLCAADSAGRA